MTIRAPACSDSANTNGQAERDLRSSKNEHSAKNERFSPMPRRRPARGNPHLSLVGDSYHQAKSQVSPRTVSIPTEEISRWFEEWCNDRPNLSRRTLEQRGDVIGKLLWFLESRGEKRCGMAELRAFFQHLEHGHLQPEGRWGQGAMVKSGKKPLRPVSQFAYHRNIKAFFGWLVKEEVLPVSPMQRVEAPASTSQQVEHFTPEHIQALLKAAEAGQYPLRDAALIWFLLDTGVRASECCQIRLEDVNFRARRVHIRHGKGDKKRLAYFNKSTEKALRAYLRSMPQRPDAPLFASESGQYLGEPLTRSGLRQIIAKLGHRARLTGVRCSRIPSATPTPS